MEEIINKVRESIGQFFEVLDQEDATSEAGYDVREYLTNYEGDPDMDAWMWLCDYTKIENRMPQLPYRFIMHVLNAFAYEVNSRNLILKENFNLTVMFEDSEMNDEQVRRLFMIPEDEADERIFYLASCFLCCRSFRFAERGYPIEADYDPIPSFICHCFKMIDERGNNIGLDDNDLPNYFEFPFP